MAKVMVNNLKFHVQQLNPKGEETVILITGILGNLAQWYFTLAPILAKEYRVIMYDFRHHGKTERAKDGFDLDTSAKDVLGLMNKLNIEKAHLVGYSYGSQVALKFAINYPDRCSNVVLLESPSPKRSLVQQIKDKHNLVTMAEVKEQLPELVYEEVMEEMRIREVSRIDKISFKAFMKIFRPLCAETSFLEDLDNEEEFEIEDLQSVKNDFLLLYGNESDCVAYAETLAKWIPYNQFLLKEGGHSYPIDNTVEVGNYITNFLRSPKDNLSLQFSN